jgi:hypothetical protein
MLMIEQQLSYNRQGFPMVRAENQAIECKAVREVRRQPSTLQKEDGKMKGYPAMSNGINGKINRNARFRIGC